LLGLTLLSGGPLSLLQAQAGPGGQLPYQNPSAPVEQRVEDLLQRMTPSEKAAMLAGSGWMESMPNARLGIPAIKMADGPMGVRSWRAPAALSSPASAAAPVFSTAFPASIGMGASWDAGLVQRVARAIAQQAKSHGRDMILGPTVNIARVPTWGRNFEGYGEDPYLTARMGVAYIKGVQGEGVIPSIKHFAANNEEYERHRIDETIDERTLHEIYLPAFKAAVDSGVWAIMSAYNKVNGQNCSENEYLLRDVLRKQWGFRGFVISDWGSTYSTEGPLRAGLDLEMPGGAVALAWLKAPSATEPGNGVGWLTGEKVLASIQAGKSTQAAVDDAVRRQLRVMFTAGLFEKQHTEIQDVETPEHKALARAAADETIVLLKNVGNLLPLDRGAITSIAVIGPGAAAARTGGGGSSLVQFNSAVTPVDAIREAAGEKIVVRYAQGVSMQGEEPSKETPEARAALLREAVEIARVSDVAVIVAGYSPALEGESFDRKSMDLPEGQDELIEAVAAVNRKTIAVIQAGGPVTMTKWIVRTPGVLSAWYGGQEAGHSISDVIFGEVNPSGKLPVSFPRRFEDSTAFGNYPGENLKVSYGEGIFVGYRGLEKRKVEPLFPFGYGLSYTTFAYSDLKVTPLKTKAGQKVTVTMRLRNTGRRAGAEVVQLYVHDGHASAERPDKELKGFARVELATGAERVVSFDLDESAFSYYSAAQHDWVIDPGQFEILAGASSGDIRLKGTVALTK
jgi:beta-glucosidase